MAVLQIKQRPGFYFFCNILVIIQSKMYFKEFCFFILQRSQIFVAVFLFLISLPAFLIEQQCRFMF